MKSPSSLQAIEPPPIPGFLAHFPLCAILLFFFLFAYFFTHAESKKALCWATQTAAGSLARNGSTQKSLGAGLGGLDQKARTLRSYTVSVI